MIGSEGEVTMETKLLDIRSRKIGICLKDARLRARKSVEDAATVLGIPAEKYTAMELGAVSPSFPQLESLAVLYRVPFDTLVQWHCGDDSTAQVDPAMMSQVVTLREHVVAAYLAKARQEKQISVESMSQQAGISAEDLQLFERAAKPVPYPVLVELAAVLDLDLPMLHSRHLTPGVAPAQPAPVTAPQEFGELPQEMLDFINKPINRPYLELAKKLSEMSVDKLRNVAESLLEITY